MHRSRSHTALNLQDNDTEDDDDESHPLRQTKGLTTEDIQGDHGYQIITWHGPRKKTPLVNFSSACLFFGAPQDAAEAVRRYHMTFKFVKTECRLVKSLLQSHGFRESHPSTSYFNLLWTGSHIKPFTYRTMTDYQKVNHFPRSYELTRKDRLYKNIQKMQYSKGFRHFDFIPSSFVLPSEMSDFSSFFLREKGFWIVKPVASSRGRGIYLINDPCQLSLDDHCLVCKYIENPLLVDGYKFDLRIYVVATSFDPLRIYMFEEGLARFSTVKYDRKSVNLNNHWMHLTNYSVNKHNTEYVRCDDPEVDDFGNKWSFSAMLRYLKDQGRDTEGLVARIEDVVVKAMLSVELSIATASRMFVPSRHNCFELFGFDILVDENLKPWLLEVNLSPSLACDAPMDLKIKSGLMCDIFNATGFVAHDPVVKCQGRIKNARIRSLSAHVTDANLLSNKVILNAKVNLGLTNEEAQIVRETKEEYKRRGGLVRIYPTPESWEQYGNLHEKQTSNNKVVHSRLFPELWKVVSQRPSSAASGPPGRTSENLFFLRGKLARSSPFGLCSHDRYLIFERKLETVSTFIKPHDSEIKSEKAHRDGNGDRRQDKVTYEVSLLKEGSKMMPVSTGRRRSLNISEIIERGETLSKIQARQAFAMYLQRVQHRLRQELSSSKQNGASEAPNHYREEEQLDLIMRFLKKASKNLSQPFDVSIPSRDILLNERRSVLSRKLGDFIKIYSKDTLALIAKEEADMTSDVGSQSDYDMGDVPERDFKMFLAIASESELEELLTVFTRSNKSSATFLGSKSENESNNYRDEYKKDRDLGNRTESRNVKARSSLHVKKQDANGNNPSWREVLETSKEENVSLHSDKYNRRLTTAKVYSSSLAVTSTKRPTSARTGADKVSNTVTNYRNRPSSAASSKINVKIFQQDTSRNRDYGATSVDDQASEAVSDALQRLLIKQSERKYSASKVPHYGSSVKTSIPSGVPVIRQSEASALSSASNLRKSMDANETFKSFVDFENSIAKYDDEAVTNANRLEHTTGTQTVELSMLKRNSTAGQDHLQPDEKQAVKLVSKAQYQAYVKSLERGAFHSDTVSVQPHPPSSKPPFIRKPIRTQRMIKLSNTQGMD